MIRKKSTAEGMKRVGEFGESISSSPHGFETVELRVGLVN